MAGENWNWSDFNTLIASGIAGGVVLGVGGVVVYYLYTRFKVCGKQEKARHDANIAASMVNTANVLKTSAKNAANGNEQGQLNACEIVEGKLRIAHRNAKESRKNSKEIKCCHLESYVDPRAERAKKFKNLAVYSLCEAMAEIPNVFAQNTLNNQAMAKANGLARYVNGATRDGLDERENDGIEVLICVHGFLNDMNVQALGNLPELPAIGADNISLQTI